MWDTIVIGSGIGGLTAAAALARRGQRVLVLEQHTVAGGLTQTFRRQGWTFATGVHYIGGVGGESGAAGQFGRLLDWLSGGALSFTSCGNPYDIVRLPGFEFGIEHPEAAYRAALLRRFPAQDAAIGRWFDEMESARRAAYALMATRSMPSWLAWGLKLWRGSEVEHYRKRTLAEALAEVPDEQLRAVLGARWGDYGAPPDQAPLLEHALVTGSYNAGAFFPVGGPERFAQTLRPVIEAPGGELRLSASVERIVVRGGRASGVVVLGPAGEQHEAAKHVVSAMGVLNTAACLDASVAAAWQQAVRALKPGLSYVSLYIGFEGDIAAAGASAANTWVYESLDIGRVWPDPINEDAPSLFVSFPSMKDGAFSGAPTAEVVVLCDSSSFAQWMHPAAGTPVADYAATKSLIEERLLAQFKRLFPALAPLLRHHELCTPLTQQRYVRSPDGAMYGVEMTSERLGTPALDVRTPVPGLLLAGQDVAGAGVQAAAMSGLMAAAAIEPALLRQLGG